MIVLTVISFNGAPSTDLSARFDELGGTIGRSDQNQLVLPDPDRTISRVHARVMFRNGGYAIVDNGSNPITVNGKPVGGGAEQGLKPGDKVQIGGYLLSVTDAQTATSDDPFADLFGEGLASSKATPAPTSAPAPAQRMATPAPGSSALPAGGGIPEDWDPFAPDPAPAQAAEAAANPLSDMQVASAESSLDDLFGLGAAPKGGDPLAAAMPRRGAANTASDMDPLAAFGRPPVAPPPTRGDLGSELNTPMPLARAPKPPPASTTVAPSDAVFSWDEPAGGRPETTQPGVQRSSRKVDVETSPPAAALARQPAASTAPTADSNALLQALLEGLAAPELRMEELTPERMRLLGQLLHEATRGTVELLVARAALKRELRADVTMIVARENNPLKFSPAVEVALQHLLGPSMPGFMTPAAAMRDAYNDLRAHQLGVMAGMRAALEGVLQRFDPEQLEAKITKRSSIADLLPGSRKARLWEQFQELFGQLQTEAQDDFDELFGKAFLKAYESHIDRLHDEPGPR